LNKHLLIQQAAEATKFSNFYVTEKAKALCPNFLGIGKNDGSIADIRLMRIAFEPSSLYGHQNGRNIAIGLDLRSQGIDIHEFDNNGIPKNSLNDLPATARIEYALKNRVRLIYIFGGSTIFGMGSRLPDFTIPSLVENALNSGSSEDAPRVVCINFGLGGTCCTESLNLLIHKALELGIPDDVIFYDGWNCASYLPLQYLAKIVNNDYQSLIHKGETMRHLEHNIYLSNSFNGSYCAYRALKLFVHKLASLSLIREVDRKKLVFRVMNRLFPLRSSSEVPRIIDSLYKSASRTEAFKEATNKFVAIHEHVAAICNYRRIRFHHFLQPLVFSGQKVLTPDEENFKISGYSSGEPSHFQEIYKMFSQSALKGLPWFHDATGLFDDVEEEVYIDSGHLNPLGNSLVAIRIAETLQSSLQQQISDHAPPLHSL